MDVLTDVLDRVRLKGTVLFHYELGRPWSLSLPKFPDAVFHYLSRGSASLALEDGRTVRMSAGDLVLVSRGEPHLLSCGRRAKPFPLLDLDRRPAHLGPVRHGGGEGPISTMICGYFSLSRRSRIGVLDALPPHLRPANDAQAVGQRVMPLAWMNAALAGFLEGDLAALHGGHDRRLAADHPPVVSGATGRGQSHSL